MSDRIGGWVDSHCHLNTFADAGEAIDRGLRGGVEALITVGTDLETSRKSIDLASRHDEVWAAVGLHPHEAKSFSSEAAERLRAYASNPRVVAIGETGLDFYRDLSPRPDQFEAFRSQIRMANELGLALIVHLRDAHNDVFRLLSEEGPVDRLVFHCFSGGVTEAERALELGGYLSFAGNLSYRKNDDLRSAAAFAPIDRILVETDSPYLAPVPHRGSRNEPAFVALVGEVLARVRGLATERVAGATSENARRAFDLTI